MVRLGGGRMCLVSRTLVAWICLTGLGGGVLAEGVYAQPLEAVPGLELFVRSASSDEDEARDALDQIAGSWRHGYVGIFRDLMRFMTPPTEQANRLLGDDPEQFGTRRPTDEPVIEFSLDDAVQRARDGNLDVFPRARSEEPSTKAWRRLARFVDE